MEARRVFLHGFLAGMSLHGATTQINLCPIGGLLTPQLAALPLCFSGSPSAQGSVVALACVLHLPKLSWVWRVFFASLIFHLSVMVSWSSVTTLRLTLRDLPCAP